MTGVRSGLIGAVLAATLLIPLMLQHDAARDREVGLERDRAEAAADTTRRLVLALGVLAEGTQAVQRRAVQAEIKADRLDRVLAQTRKMNTDLTLDIEQFRGLSQSATSIVESPDTVAFTWNIRQPPYTIIDTTKVSRSLSAAVLSINVKIDPPGLNVRVGCGPPKRENNGIRPVALTVTAPLWLHVTVDDVLTTPSVCNPEPAKPWIRNWRTWVALSLGAVAALRR